MRYSYAILLLLAAVTRPATAQQPSAPADSAKRFSFNFRIATNFKFHFAYAFDPDSLLSQHDSLGLTREQAREVATASRESMAAFAPLKEQLATRQAELDRILAAPRVDEAAAVAALDRVMQLENTIKRLRLTLLIHTKNTLAPAQQRLRWQSGGNEP